MTLFLLGNLPLDPAVKRPPPGLPPHSLYPHKATSSEPALRITQDESILETRMQPEDRGCGQGLPVEGVGEDDEGLSGLTFGLSPNHPPGQQ